MAETKSKSSELDGFSTPQLTSTESPVSINFRMTDPAGIECQITLRAVRADSIEEALDVLDLRKQVVESMLAEGWSASRGFGGAPTSPPPVADPNAPSCKHGQRLKKTGNSKKTGKPYVGYVCPERNRSAQCEAIWE